VSLAAPERSALLITRMIRCFAVDGRIRRLHRSHASLFPLPRYPSLRAGLSFTSARSLYPRPSARSGIRSTSRVRRSSMPRFRCVISSETEYHHPESEGKEWRFVTARFLAAASGAINAPQMIKRMRAIMKLRERTAHR